MSLRPIRDLKASRMSSESHAIPLKMPNISKPFASDFPFYQIEIKISLKEGYPSNSGGVYGNDANEQSHAVVCTCTCTRLVQRLTQEKSGAVKEGEKI